MRLRHHHLSHCNFCNIKQSASLAGSALNWLCQCRVSLQTDISQSRDFGIRVLPGHSRSVARLSGLLTNLSGWLRGGTSKSQRNYADRTYPDHGPKIVAVAGWNYPDLSGCGGGNDHRTLFHENAPIRDLDRPGREQPISL